MKNITMNINNKFSYVPYKVFGKKEIGIDIVRLAPDKHSVSLEWIGKKKSYKISIYYNGGIYKELSTEYNLATIDSLKENTEYTVIVSAEKEISEERLFITGDYYFPVIDYLHPEDLTYSFSGRFLATPYIIRYKGDLFTICDCFRGGNQTGAFNLSKLFKSSDNGNNWKYITDLVPCFWPTLFVANGKLCVLSCTTEFGSLTVSSSEDGVNWESPLVLMYGSGYQNPGPHKGAGAPLYYDNKIYFGIEYGGHSVKRFDSLVATLDLSKEVMNLDAWIFSEKLMIEHEWGGDKDIRFAVEGNMVEREGKIFDILRFTAGKALMLEFDKDHVEKPLKFYKVIDLPLGHCKFFIQKSDNGYYYAMGNTTCYPRHVIQIYRSADLEKWEFVKTVADISEKSPENDGIQYPTFVLEGNSLLTVFRIALNGADTFHNSNALAFKIIEI